MGSFKHKINNNKKKKQENAAVNELVQLKKKMKEQYEAGEYVEAMDTMAEIAQRKKMDPEVMYMGASCYFMTGDYERAAKWVNNTLSYDPQNVPAKLLLARLCFVEDKAENGFAILDLLVEKDSGAMGEEEKKTLLEMLGYCKGNMPDLMEKHPLLLKYHEDNCVGASPTCTAPKDEGRSKAQAAVDRLKSLLNKSKGNKDPQQSMEKVTEAPAAPVTVAASNTIDVNDSAASVVQIVDKVMASDISLRDKVKSLNNFASGLYLNDDYDGALKLLQKALEIDSHDPFVLRNIAYVCLAMKEKDKALEYASKLPMIDFALIKAIKGHCHG